MEGNINLNLLLTKNSPYKNIQTLHLWEKKFKNIGHIIM